MDRTNRVSHLLPTALNPMRLDLPPECYGNLYQEPADGREVAPHRLLRQSPTIAAYFAKMHSCHWQVFERDPRPLLAYPTPPTEEDIRIHAWLAKRLAALDRERHGLWPRILRFLRGF